MQTLYVWVLVLAVVALANAGRTMDKWKAMDVEDLEKNYESSDDREEMETEADRLQRVIRGKGMDYAENPIDSFKKATKSHPEMFGGGVGGSMIFVSLNKEHEFGANKGKERTTAEFGAIATRYNEMMKTGGLVVDVRNTDINVLMFNLHRGWLTAEVEKFLSMQTEVMHWTNDGNKYTPKEYRALHKDWDDVDEDDDDEL
jgi:hypothetical protein